MSSVGNWGFWSRSRGSQAALNQPSSQSTLNSGAREIPMNPIKATNFATIQVKKIPTHKAGQHRLASLFHDAVPDFGSEAVGSAKRKSIRVGDQFRWLPQPGDTATVALTSETIAELKTLERFLRILPGVTGRSTLD